MASKVPASRGGPPAPSVVGSNASWGRRLVALLIDWIASWLVAVLVFGPRILAPGHVLWEPLLVLWLESSIGVAFAGASFGQLLSRVRVFRTTGAPVSLGRALLRQLLVCLVVPPLVFRGDGRGLHDMWTDTGAYDLVIRK